MFGTSAHFQTMSGTSVVLKTRSIRDSHYMLIGERTPLQMVRAPGAWLCIVVHDMQPPCSRIGNEQGGTADAGEFSA